MEVETICVFNKFGFCKYGVTCRKKHEDLKCENSSCEIFNCSKRHPKECKYYREFNRCKYNEYCRYEHKQKECSKGNGKQECKHMQLEDRISELEKILENTEKNFKVLNDKFLEKEARFKDLEEKLNEFVTSLKTNDVVSKNLREWPAPTTDFMPFDSKEVNNNDQSENIERELEETDFSYNFFTCSADDIEGDSNESSTDVEEIDITSYVEVPMSEEEEIDVASFVEVPMLTEDSESSGTTTPCISPCAVNTFRRTIQLRRGWISTRRG